MFGCPKLFVFLLLWFVICSECGMPLAKWQAQGTCCLSLFST